MIWRTLRYSHVLSHIDKAGDASMVSISHKAVTSRTAKAEAFIYYDKNSGLGQLLDQENEKKGLPKGNKNAVFTTARISGIMAAKRTCDLIPLAHQIPLSCVNISISHDIEKSKIAIESSIECVASTGAEMEALTAATITGLTIYDMCKAVDKTMTLTDVRLLKKTGGKSGDYTLKKI